MSSPRWTGWCRGRTAIGTPRATPRRTSRQRWSEHRRRYRCATAGWHWVSGRESISRSSTARGSGAFRSPFWADNTKPPPTGRLCDVDPSSLFLSGCRCGAADLLLFAVSAGGAAADRNLHRLGLGRLRLRHCQGQHAVDELRPGLLADRILGKGNLPAELAIEVLAEPVALRLGAGWRHDLTLDIDLAAVERDVDGARLHSRNSGSDHPLLVGLVDVQGQVALTDRADGSRLARKAKSVAEKTIHRAVKGHQITDR